MLLLQALLIYFRLVQTPGVDGCHQPKLSESRHRRRPWDDHPWESFTLPVALGLFAAIAGVALINWPVRPSKANS